MQNTAWATQRKSPASTAVPFEASPAGVPSSLRTEVFGLEFAHEAGTWGVDHLELFCEGEMGMIGFTQRRVQTKPQMTAPEYQR
jgi:hypothetical protein